MENIITNIIIWVVVPLIIGRLTFKANLNRKKVREVESCKSNSLEGEGEGEQIEDRFVLEIGRGVKLITIIPVIIFGIIFVVNIGTYAGGWDLGKGIDLGTVILFGVFFLLCFALLLAVTGWKLTVVKDTIFYRNYFFITKQYKFPELDKVIYKKNGNIVVYREGKKIFLIDFIIWSKVDFVYQARVYNVDIVYKN